MSILQTLVVPAAHVDLARELCAKIAGPAGDGMFIRGLSATGNAPATHYASSGLIGEEFVALIQAGPQAVYAQAQAAGIATNQQAVTTLLTASDISGEEPFAALARLGLSLIE